MKKIVCGILVTAMVAAMGTVGVSAAGRFSGRGYRFVDNNQDGICDFYGTGSGGYGFVDADNDGICDNWGTNGMGYYFVDEDHDGVCDLAGTRTGCRMGMGKQYACSR